MPRYACSLFLWLLALSLGLLTRPLGATCGLELETVLVEHTPCGSAVGRVSVILRGTGTAPLTYLWSNGATTPSLTGLAAGAYQLTLTDAQGCALQTEALVRDFGSAQLSNLTLTPALCASANGGMAFTLTGNAPYLVNWTGPVSGSLTNQSNNVSIGNLEAGSYLLEWQDANGCRAFRRVEIVRNGGISMLASAFQRPSCGVPDGVLRASATAGSLPFTFFLNDVLVGTFPSSSQDFTNLSAGTYRLRIRDNSGCEANAVFTLDELGATPLNTGDFQFGNALCPAGDEGFIRETSPSALAYEVFDLRSNQVVGPLPQNNLPAGPYEVRLTTGGCRSALFVNLTGPLPWRLETQAENPVCQAGRANVLTGLSGANGAYLYQWSNGTTNANLTNVFPNNYALTLTDGAGCSFVRTDIRVSNCSSTEELSVRVGQGLNFCVDTLDISGAVGSVLNLCSGSVRNGSLNALGIDGCLSYTAGAQMGLDTVCVEVCNAARDFCDTTTVVINILAPLDTILVPIATNTNEVVCPSLGALPSALVSATDLSCRPLRLGLLNGIDQTTGCVDYAAGLVMGRDTICVAYCDGNFCDTTVYVFVIQSPIDTQRLSLVANSNLEACMNLGVFPGVVQSVTDLSCSVLQFGGLAGINFATACADYAAGNRVGVDTLCLAVCDDQGFCDTTIILFEVVPRSDTVRLTLGAGTAAVDTCLFGFQFPASGITSITDLGCDALNEGGIVVDLATGCIRYTPPASVPNAGLRSDTVCLVFCDANYCDTAVFIFDNLEPDCSNRVVPANLGAQGPNCANLGLCLPIPFDSISFYNLSIDGSPYGGLVTGCAFVTRIQYPFSLIPGCPGNFTITWRIGNVNFGPVQVTGLQGIINQMNVWDQNTVWQLTGNNGIALGINQGNDNLVYGNLNVQCVGAAVPTVLGPTTQNQVAGGSNISFAAPGRYELWTRGPLGCVDTTVVEVLCAQTSVVLDTIILGDSIRNCNIDLSQVNNVQRVENVCTGSGLVGFSLDANLQNCLNYVGLGLGQDTACVVVCDTVAGVCDTTIFIVTVILPVPIAVRDSFVMPFNASSFSFDVCANDSFPRLAFGIRILDQPSRGVLTGGDCDWVYRPNNPNVCGVDSFRYELSNASGLDTAWVYVVAPCRPFSISEGISPNGDGINDFFVVNSLQDFPNHELLIFNRWGNLVFQARDYQNDWSGTFNGRDLPDGVYFYFIYLNNARGDIFQGTLIIRR